MRPEDRGLGDRVFDPGEQSSGATPVPHQTYSRQRGCLGQRSGLTDAKKC
jgi:hypothetical protein